MYSNIGLNSKNQFVPAHGYNASSWPLSMFFSLNDVSVTSETIIIIHTTKIIL